MSQYQPEVRNYYCRKKAVLCVKSSMFDRMSENDAEENINQIIERDDLDFNIVKDFVSFLYTEKLKYFLQKKKSLYYIADNMMWQIFEKNLLGT